MDQSLPTRKTVIVGRWKKTLSPAENEAQLKRLYTLTYANLDSVLAGKLDPDDTKRVASCLALSLLYSGWRQVPAETRAEPKISGEEIAKKLLRFAMA